MFPIYRFKYFRSNALCRLRLSYRNKVDEKLRHMEENSSSSNNDMQEKLESFEVANATQNAKIKELSTLV